MEINSDSWAPLVGLCAKNLATNASCSKSASSHYFEEEGEKLIALDYPSLSSLINQRFANFQKVQAIIIAKKRGWLSNPDHRQSAKIAFVTSIHCITLLKMI